MKTVLIVASALLCLASAAVSADDQIDSGREKAHPCMTCHGVDGLRHSGAMAIGGRDYYDLLYDMARFRDGERFNPIMSILMRTLSEADMADVAAYFASIDRRKLNQLGPYGVR
jgi:cytochrome c553